LFFTIGPLKSARRSKPKDNGRGVTLADVQESLGTHASVISNLETVGYPPRWATTRAYLDFLGLDVHKLLDEFENVRRFYGDQIPADLTQERRAS
jgi:hypothetical protein